MECFDYDVSSCVNRGVSVLNGSYITSEVIWSQYGPVCKRSVRTHLYALLGVQSADISVSVRIDRQTGKIITVGNVLSYLSFYYYTFLTDTCCFWIWSEVF